MTQCIGIDIHRKFIQVCVMDEQGNDCGQARLEMEARQEMTRVFSRFPQGTQVAVEATMAWGWLSDLLEELGLQVHLAHMRGGGSSRRAGARPTRLMRACWRTF